MLVPCPRCGFLVASILPTADGAHASAQRCPQCEAPLSTGLAAAADRAATHEPDPAPTAPHAGAPAADKPDDRVHAQPGEPALAAPTPTPAPVAPPRRAARRAPSFVRHATPTVAAPRRWQKPLAIAVLALVLVLQLLLAQRQELAATARWRPLVAGLCAVLQCELPPWREPAAFTMLSRNVQPEPGAAGVLRASASFRNDARWPQPWPTLLLGLSDIDGQQVGARAFSPREYSGADADPPLLAPGEAATVQFDVLEPAPRIVAFTFDFQ
ncbi:DUF3426 domain-containing protein [Lysobacter koreensis]|uniref:DUF3426 domain-containing protein n=1 Tax=Lysobacter koreensis TaxID=266122 RepID=A0ABW2YNS4_9GAMM